MQGNGIAFFKVKDAGRQTCMNVLSNAGKGLKVDDERIAEQSMIDED